MQVGKKQYGNSKTAMFGCSNANCWMGKGDDKIANETINIKNNIPEIFQRKKN